MEHNAKRIRPRSPLLCPLEPLQLPTYDGTKSYQNLLVGVYGGQEGANWLPNINLDTITQSVPISLVRSGYYDYKAGNVNSRNIAGNYWESRVSSESYADRLNFDIASLLPQINYIKSQGFQLRCLVR